MLWLPICHKTVFFDLIEMIIVFSCVFRLLKSQSDQQFKESQRIVMCWGHLVAKILYMTGIHLGTRFMSSHFTIFLCPFIILDFNFKFLNKKINLKSSKVQLIEWSYLLCLMDPWSLSWHLVDAYAWVKEVTWLIKLLLFNVTAIIIYSVFRFAGFNVSIF